MCTTQLFQAVGNVASTAAAAAGGVAGAVGLNRLFRAPQPPAMAPAAGAAAPAAGAAAPASQVAKMPDEGLRRQAAGAVSGKRDSTMLTGPGGVAPGLLNLGQNTLLGR